MNCRKSFTNLKKQIKELQAAEEELRCAHEEQAAMTDELENKMRLSEQYISQLASAQETAELGYWSSDLEGAITWSEQMYRIFGLSQSSQGWGPTLEEYHATLHPEDITLSIQKADEALKVGKVRYRLRVIKEDGAVRYVDMIVNRNTGYRGELVGIAGVSRDITDEVTSRKTLIEAKETAERVGRELERTKEMLEQTSAVARVGGWEVNMTENTVYWNRMTREIHEVPEDFVPDVTTGINFYKEGHSRERIQEVVARATKTGEPWNEELQIVTHQGNDCWVRAHWLR